MLQADGDLDYVVLPLAEGAFAQARADAEHDAETISEDSGWQRRFISVPVELGDAPLEPRHELLILHHLAGKELVLTQRYWEGEQQRSASAHRLPLHANSIPRISVRAQDEWGLHPVGALKQGR